MSGNGASLLGSLTLPGIVWALAPAAAGGLYAGGVANSDSTQPFPTTAGAQ